MRSFWSVIGKNVTNLDSIQALQNVYLGSARIADERNGSIVFNSTDPLTLSTRETDEDGATFPGDEDETRNELVGLGTTVSHNQPMVMPPPNYARGGFAGNSEAGCIIDGTLHDGPSKCFKVLKKGIGDVNSDPFTLSAAGIYRRPRYGYREYKPEEPIRMDDPDEDETPVRIATEEERYISGWDYYIFGITLSSPNDDLRRAVEERLKNKTCKDKLNAVLKQLLGKKNFDKLTNKKTGATGFDALVANFFDGGRVDEVMSGLSRYNTLTGVLTMNVDPARRGTDLEFIHEGLHGAKFSGFSHKKIYQAMAKVDDFSFKQFEKDRARELKNQRSTNPDKDSAMFSSAMNAWINRHCR